MPAQVGAGVAAAVAVGAEHGVVHGELGADLFGVGADVVGGDDGRALAAFEQPGDVRLARGLGFGVEAVVICSIRALAACAAMALAEAMTMVPSSWISIWVPVSLVIAWITEPPLPITSRILSGWILMVIRRGAKSESSGRGAVSAPAISPRMCRRPCLAWASATFMISSVMPWILMSICRAEMPPSVPATF